MPAPARPVQWVPFLLCAAVLAAGLAARPPLAQAAGFAAGVLGLAGVEWLDRHRPRRVLLAARLALLLVVAAFDRSGLTGALFIVVPFGAYFTFGRRVALALGLGGAAALAGYYALIGGEHRSDLLMYAVGLVLALSMAAVAVGELHARTELEAAMRDVAGLSAAQERNRLARDIHDSLGHHLTAITVQLEKAEAFRDRDAAAAHRAIADARWSARRALEEVRDSVRALRDAPLSLHDLARHAADERMRISLAVDGDEEALDPPVRMAVYRAAQEALTNARRHGAAGAVSIVADFRAGAASLVVADDGVGLAEPHRDGFGLQGMRERVRLLGGTVSVANADRGVTVTVRIPGG
ncbi:sensor histidine kinase [Dactylosporangium sp. CA-092794]|uniref:sensor histidine kinase n=1 Tax=Dactylosporangium sp. CA-092794 TaxID=3239929 RepID=UPI003D9298F7